MQQGFVKLNDLDPNIQSSIRYGTSHNFIGAPIPGYLSDKSIIISEEAAKQLLKVQSTLNNDGFNLVVYDAFRPQRAVDHFIEWSKNNNTRSKDIFYPDFSKKDLFDMGFIAEGKSTHTRGSTVDITIIEKSKMLSHNPQSKCSRLESGREIPFYDDNTVDMGGSFDLFDLVSFGNNTDITEQQQQMRLYLQEIMVNHGFEPYTQEWWHFTLKNEPFPDTYFDFDVV